MYNNIGGKIKFAAQLIFMLGVAGAIIVFAAGIFLAQEAGSFLMVLVALVVAAVVFLGGWISTWFMYGYGELIESTAMLLDEVKQLNRGEAAAKPEDKDRPAAADAGEEAPPFWCQMCDYPGPFEGLCPQCGSNLRVYNDAAPAAEPEPEAWAQPDDWAEPEAWAEPEELAETEEWAQPEELVETEEWAQPEELAEPDEWVQPEEWVAPEAAPLPYEEPQSGDFIEPAPQPAPVQPEEPAKKFCRTCGSKVESDSLFCQNCGTRLL